MKIFLIIGWTVPLKTKNAQTLPNSFKKIHKSSKTSFTMKAVLKYNGLGLDNITDGKLKILLENNIPGGPSSCMDNRHVKSGERKTK